MSDYIYDTFLQNILSVQEIYHYFTIGQQMVNEIYTSQIYITVACTCLCYYGRSMVKPKLNQCMVLKVFIISDLQLKNFCNGSFEKV